jgi:hypothetical protein
MRPGWEHSPNSRPSLMCDIDLIGANTLSLSGPMGRDLSGPIKDAPPYARVQSIARPLITTEGPHDPQLRGGETVASATSFSKVWACG